MKSKTKNTRFIISGKDIPWEDMVTKLKDDFGFNLSLKYPDKVKLPLEEFCDFYFRSKELNHLNRKERIERAYNDAVSTALVYFTAPTSDGFSSYKEFYEKRSDVLNEYLSKAIFAKFYAEKYMRSTKNAADFLNEWSLNLEMYLHKVDKSYPGAGAYVKKTLNELAEDK